MEGSPVGIPLRSAKEKLVKHEEHIYPAKNLLCSKGHTLTRKNGLELPDKRKMCRTCRGLIHQRSYGSHLKLANGSIVVFVPDHPNSWSHGWYPRSRLVIEDLLGRLLDPEERVLHLGDPDDDHPSQLKLFPSAREMSQWQMRNRHPRQEEFAWYDQKRQRQMVETTEAGAEQRAAARAEVELRMDLDVAFDKLRRRLRIQSEGDNG